MTQHLNLIGRKFEKLTVISQAESRNRKAFWNCKCDCGTASVVRTSSLTSGNTRSCGCLQKEIASLEGKKRYKHGFSSKGLCSSGVYKSWSHMKQRCLNENNKSYPRYGGRGIEVCEEWIEFENFYKWALENGYKKGLSIERINKDGDYRPDNCKWATSREQNNNKSGNQIILYQGQEKTIGEWAEILNIKYSTLHARIKNGWDVKQAFLTPVGKQSVPG